MPRIMLEAPTPAAFIDTHLLPRLERHDDGGTDLDNGVWLTLADMLAEDAALLRDVHTAMVAGGDPAKAVANYFAGWVAGYLAEVVGFVWVTADAGVVVDETVRWRLHSEGYPDRIDVSRCRVVVRDTHPWAGCAGVDDLPTRDDVRRQTTEALVAFLTPFIETCRTLAKVGRNALWAEVADGLATATALAAHIDAGEGIPRVQELLDADGMPWRKRPKLWTAEGRCGPMVVVQKGGCCLAYTGGDDDHDHEDEEHRLYVERFPKIEGQPAYCATCSFREPHDVEARQVFWSDLMERKNQAVCH